MWYILQFLVMLGVMFASIYWHWFDDGLPGAGLAALFVAMLCAVIVTAVLNKAILIAHRIRHALRQ